MSLQSVCGAQMVWWRRKVCLAGVQRTGLQRKWRGANFSDQEQERVYCTVAEHCIYKQKGSGPESVVSSNTTAVGKCGVRNTGGIAKHCVSNISHSVSQPFYGVVILPRGMFPTAFSQYITQLGWHLLRFYLLPPAYANLLPMG